MQARIQIPLLSAVLMVASQAWAQPTPPRPPPEAFTACEAKKSSDTCQVELGDHTLDGTCTAGPGDKLSCRPNHPPRGPPPEALAACQDKAANAACSVSFRNDTFEGRCIDGPNGKACLPDEPPPPSN